MIDLYLRASTPETLASACPFLWGEDGWITSSDCWAFDPIGPIVSTPGIYDEDGNEVTPPVIDDRFHANLRCTEGVAAMVPEEIRVHPETPRRVWA